MLFLPEIEFGTDEDDGHVWTVVSHLGIPLRPAVLK